MRRAPTVLAAASLLLVAGGLVGCSGSDDGGQEPAAPQTSSDDVLEGSGEGVAEGSTEEVPFDAEAAQRGAQPAPDSPAVVLVPSDDGRQTITARVTVTSVEEGEVRDLVVDDVPPRRARGAQAYFVSYRLEYVSGPVLRGFGSAYLDLTSGGKVVSNEIELYSGITGDCGADYVVKNFGKGAVVEGCTIRFVTRAQPEPDGVGWTAPVKGTPSPQVTWPLARG